MDTHSSRLQISDIDICNRLEIQRQINDPILLDDFVPRVREFIKDSMPNAYVFAHIINVEAIK